MGTHFYYFTVLFLVVLHAYVDAAEIKVNKSINHKNEFAFFSFTILITTFVLYKKPIMPFSQWLFFCAITVAILRVGFYDFCLNKFRRKSIWYTSQNADGNYNGAKESLYDDVLYKLGINANSVRVCGVLASIVWYFII